MRFKLVDENDRMVGFVEFVVPLVEGATIPVNSVENAGSIPGQLELGDTLADERSEEASSCSSSEVLQTSLFSEDVSGSSNVKDIVVKRDAHPRKRNEVSQADLLRVLNHWADLANPRTRALTPSRERLLRTALTEATADECCVAIDGLFAYRQTRHGSTDLSAVFATYPGSSPLRERIDFFISQVAEDAQAEAINPSVESDKLLNAKRDVRTAWEMPTSVQASEKAAKAVEWLQQVGYEVVEQADGQPLVRQVKS